jgi:hypothetical protein
MEQLAATGFNGRGTAYFLLGCIFLLAIGLILTVIWRP